MDGTGPKPTPESRNSQSDSLPASDPDATRSATSNAASSYADSYPIKFIGPYRLVRRLGQGGMGQVWLAEQTEPIKRTVALKLIKVGLYDDELLQRFRAERQSLAMMDHPAIAKVFDADATHDGQPYFVMEYVSGAPITQYCDDKRLTIAQRLDLFVSVCEGVQHAHQKAMIHRDLKPANILVTEIDGKPVPRIIDFGLAKAIGPQSPDEIIMTRAGGWVGTPGYMSPEQAGGSADVDTRTDVYALGVLLYVLLTGDQPFDASQWKAQPFYEVLRQLRELDPPRPSTKIRGGEPSSQSTAESRGVQIAQLKKLLHGDLDWITMKAIERDRARRYATPHELAADIERHLRNEPVLARPAGTGYRARKYIRRHRIGVSLAAVGALLLISFAVMQAVQLRRVRRERDRADRITQFMTDMFKIVDPSEARGNAVTAREILDRASQDIDRGLATDPELQAQMMRTMGEVYGSLGLYPRAQPLFEKAGGIERRVLGPDDPQTIRSMADLEGLLIGRGRYAEAEKLSRETLAIRGRVFGPEHPETSRSMMDLSNALVEEGRFDEGEKFVRKALEIRRRVLGPEDPQTLRAAMNLGWVLGREGRYPEADQLLRETLESQRRILGQEHLDTRNTIGALTKIYLLQARYAEAEKLQRETLEVYRRIFGPDHLRTIEELEVLAIIVAQQNRPAEAEDLFREVLESRRRILGEEHPATLGSVSNLGVMLSRRGHYSEAETLYRETLEKERRILGPENPTTLDTMLNLGDTLMKSGRYTEAEDEFERTRAIQRRVLGPEHPLTAQSTYNLGWIAAQKGECDKAFSLIQQAVDHGLGPRDALGIEKDPALNSLHRDPRFAVLVAEAKQRAATAQSTK